MRASFLPLAIAFLTVHAHAAPTTRTVDTLLDATNPLDGLTSLREAVTASDSGDIVDFAPALNGKTLRLDQGEIVLGKSITIAGGFFSKPVIAAAKIAPERLFVVPAGVAPTLSLLVLRGGFADKGGAVFSEGNLLLENCRFEDNTATVEGGAIYHEVLTLTMRDCTFVGNRAPTTAAVTVAENAFLSAEDCVFEGNVATAGAHGLAGGVAVNVDGSGAELTGCLLIGNTAVGGGAALGVSWGDVFATRCVIAGNDTGSGVGLFHGGGTFRNCVVSGNGGRGIFAHSHESAVNLRNCTLSGNGVTAIQTFNQGLSIRNSVVWNHQFGGSGEALEASMLLQGAAVLVADFSLVQNYDLTGVGVGNLDGTDPANDPGFAIPVDPASAPTTDGDFTPDMFSTLVDAGDSTFGVGNTDVAGNARVVGPEVDMGAYEVQQKVIFIDAVSAANPADGFTWATAFPNLGDAIAASGSGDVLRLAEGVYPADVGAGRIAGDIGERFEIDHPLTLIGGYPAGGGARDLSVHVTIVSGDIADDDANQGDVTQRVSQIRGANSYVLFLSDPGDGEVVLDGLVITAADGSEELIADRGGVSVDSGTVRLFDCQLVGNRRAAEGRDAALEFRRCEISGNSGVPKRSVAFFSCDLRYVNTHIFNNHDQFDHVDGTVLAVNMELSGNGIGFELAGEAVGEFVNVTAAGNRLVPFVLTDTASAEFTNSIIWNNGINQAPDSSFWGHPTTTFNFSHCIVQHHDLTDEGVGNFDGTDPLSNPAFQWLNPPSWAPIEGGRYWLSNGSPAEGAGDSAANDEPFDLRGGARVRGAAISLGATEEVFARLDEDDDGLPDWWEFEFSDPQEIEPFDPNGDDDSDGLSNIAEYVHGLDPTVANVPGDYLQQIYVESGDMPYFALAFRVSAASTSDFLAEVERSTDLGGDDPWSTDDTRRERDAEGPFERVYRSEVPYGDQFAEFLRVTIQRVPF